MRLAVLSDVHGNLRALEAVLADVRGQGVDLTVNLGDVLSGPLEPAETADLLMGLALPTVAGNHERQLLACAARPGGPSDQWAFEHTEARHREWLRSLPATLQLPGGVLLCHGTPASDVTHFLHQVEPAGIRPATDAEVEARAAGAAAGLVLCGHTHLPAARALSGGRLLVNPGSVGLQAYDDDQPFAYGVENGSPHARYAVCQRGPAGWEVAFRCVAYDHLAAARTARAHGRESWGRCLETGRR